MLDKFRERKLLQLNDFIHNAEIGGSQVLVVEFDDMKLFLEDLISEVEVTVNCRDEEPVYREGTFCAGWGEHARKFEDTLNNKE
jgi:hypothetical protein